MSNVRVSVQVGVGRAVGLMAARWLEEAVGKMIAPLGGLQIGEREATMRGSACGGEGQRGANTSGYLE